jgi:hypothetical protein
MTGNRHDIASDPNLDPIVTIEVTPMTADYENSVILRRTIKSRFPSQSLLPF